MDNQSLTYFYVTLRFLLYQNMYLKKLKYIHTNAYSSFFVEILTYHRKDP